MDGWTNKIFPIVLYRTASPSEPLPKREMKKKIEAIIKRKRGGRECKRGGDGGGGGRGGVGICLFDSGTCYLGTQIGTSIWQFGNLTGQILYSAHECHKVVKDIQPRMTLRHEPLRHVMRTKSLSFFFQITRPSRMPMMHPRHLIALIFIDESLARALRNISSRQI